MNIYKVDKEAIEKLYEDVEKMALAIFLSELIKRIAKTIVDNRTGV